MREGDVRPTSAPPGPGVLRDGGGAGPGRQLEQAVGPLRAERSGAPAPPGLLEGQGHVTQDPGQAQVRPEVRDRARLEGVEGAPEVAPDHEGRLAETLPEHALQQVELRDRVVGEQLLDDQEPLEGLDSLEQPEPVELLDHAGRRPRKGPRGPASTARGPRSPGGRASPGRARASARSPAPRRDRSRTSGRSGARRPRSMRRGPGPPGDPRPGPLRTRPVPATPTPADPWPRARPSSVSSPRPTSPPCTEAWTSSSRDTSRSSQATAARRRAEKSSLPRSSSEILAWTVPAASATSRCGRPRAWRTSRSRSPRRLLNDRASSAEAGVRPPEGPSMPRNHDRRRIVLVPEPGCHAIVDAHAGRIAQGRRLRSTPSARIIHPPRSNLRGRPGPCDTSRRGSRPSVAVRGGNRLDVGSTARRRMG